MVFSIIKTVCRIYDKLSSKNCCKQPLRSECLSFKEVYEYIWHVNFFSDMFRAVFFFVCLLLAVFGESLASSKDPITPDKRYRKCFVLCEDCKITSAKRACMNIIIDTPCEQQCMKHLPKVEEENIEEDEQNYFLRKRELSELKELIGVGF